MSPDHFFERIGESIAKHTDGKAECDVSALRDIRQDFQEAYTDAMAEAPCEHPPTQVWHGRCFWCGRDVPNGETAA